MHRDVKSGNVLLCDVDDLARRAHTVVAKLSVGYRLVVAQDPDKK
jgi:hypothetical protein